ncbi:glycosyltransferase family 9 protein [Candidatus Binatia bacterium]|nr:glycosyltransferase family 9 protein [Candidatus Binatia bacterium]
MSEPRVPARTVVIVLLGAIGDVTRALPLLVRLRRGYPEARLCWAVEPAAAPLLERHAALDSVLVFDRPRGARAFVSFLGAVRRLRADLVVDLQRHLKSGVIGLASGARVRLGFHRRNAREGNWLFNTDHVAPMEHFSSKLRQFLAFGDWLGLPETPIEFGLRLNDAEEAKVERLLANVERPFVAAFVGSSCEARLWFPERTAAVADALAGRGLATVLVGGAGDVGYGVATVQVARSPVVDLTGRTSLRDLIGIFARARAAFGPDSGPMHIAAAVGTPTVSLWGATSAQRSAPWGNEAGVIEGVADCRPCYRKTCPIGRLCMQAITVEAVVERVAGSKA